MVVSLLSLIGLYELYKTMRIERTFPGWIGCITTVCTAFFFMKMQADIYRRSVYGCYRRFSCHLCCIRVTFPKFKADQIAFSVLDGYVPVLMMHLYQIRELPDGLFIIPLVFLSAWGNDTCAYCVGMLIGKHKMTPKLSRKRALRD
ncbi:MAG: phosphatidate cytidylyltransferase [Frisingicoccus sp.]